MKALCLVLVFLPIIFGDTLLLVQSLFRHGDRTPTSTYPNDPYREEFWNQSWGQLTTLGMQQHFEQGIKLRDRYTVEYKFMPSEYKDFNVYVRSTDVNRTLMSAYSQLAGFYADSVNSYPASNGLWPSHWTPVPVHTVEEETDHLLNTNPICPRMEDLQNERNAKPGYQAFMKVQEPLLRTIADKAGIKTTDFSTYASTAKFYASTSIEKFHNLTLPSWITDSLWEQFVNGKRLNDDYLYGEEGFGEPEIPELIMLKGGLLLKTMIGNMDLALTNRTKIKFFMYSAHDTTINAFLRALQAKQGVIGHGNPGYTSVVLLELWKSSRGDAQPYIKAHYIPDAASQPQIITPFIKGCDGRDTCLLDAFKTRSQPFLPDNIYKACQII